MHDRPIKYSCFIPILEDTIYVTFIRIGIMICKLMRKDRRIDE
jgi:hypothetical protein